MSNTMGSEKTPKESYESTKRDTQDRSGAGVSEAESASQPTPTAAAGPPALPGPWDTGLIPWLQVVGNFAVWVNTWGLFNSFGEYQTYYQQSLLSSKSPDDIAWIGSLQAFLLLFLGLISGPLYDAGYLRHLLIAGNFLVVFGMMMTSLCTQYWQFILAQGIVVGAGFGLLFTPIVSLIPQWFQKRKALAAGVSAAGSGIGGVIYPIIFRNLEPSIGFGWATRVIGFLALFFAIVSISVLRTKFDRAPKIRTLVDTEAFTELPYVMYCIGGFLTFCGIYGPWFYIGQYSLQLAITSTSLAPYLVVLVNAGSVVGRIFLSTLADKVGLLNVGFLSVFCSSILAFAWIGIKNTPGLIIFALLYGAFAGCYLGIASLIVLPLTADLRKLGTRIGQISVVASFAALIGTPISGAILRAGHSFLGIQIFVGSLLLVGSVAIWLAKVAKLGWNSVVKM